MAKNAVPPGHWSKTPVVLKATAGLRLLAEQKAQALLSQVMLGYTTKSMVLYKCGGLFQSFSFVLCHEYAPAAF